MKDRVQITDHLELTLGQKQMAPAVFEKEPVLIEGFFSAVCRERGKIVPGTRREGKNIWTLAGREYLARLMSYAVYGIGLAKDVPARNDRVRYLGMGTGTQPEVATVSKLQTPVAWDEGGGQFLAELGIPTYPFQVSSTNFGNAVRYVREYAELELSSAGTIILSEAGLYTDGSPTASPAFAPKTRSLILTEANAQVPVAYKTFEALKKTQSFVLQVAWEVRF